MDLKENAFDGDHVIVEAVVPNLHIGIIDTKEVEKTTRAKNKCVYRLDSELHSPKIILTINIIIVVITRVFKKLRLGLYSLGDQVFNPQKTEKCKCSCDKSVDSASLDGQCKGFFQR